MNWLDKLSALIQVSENTKTFFKTFTSIVGVAIACISTRNFMVANKLDSPARIQQFFFVSDNRIEMQKILKKVGKDNKASRAFFMFYEQMPDGQFMAVFKEYYQWQPKGQVKIFDAKYSIKKGADSDRKNKIEKGRCAQISAGNYPEGDDLAASLLASNVSFQIVCPVIGVTIEGRERLGVLGLEYAEMPQNKTKIEAALLEATGDASESFNYAKKKIFE